MAEQTARANNERMKLARLESLKQALASCRQKRTSIGTSTSSTYYADIQKAIFELAEEHDKLGMR
jgi:hypothetical protein